MRIGISASVLSDKRRNSTGKYTLLFISALLSLSNDVECYLYSGNRIHDDVKESLKKYKNVYYREGTSFLKYSWEFLFMPFWMKKDKIDVAIIVDELLPAFCNIPSILIIHDLIWRYFPDLPSAHSNHLQRINLKRSARKADYCMTDSHSTQKDLSEFTGIPISKIDVAYPGIDPGFIRAKDAGIKRIIDFLSIPQPYILFMGNLMRHKNIERLVKAYKIFRVKCAQAKKTQPELVMAGCRIRKETDIDKTLSMYDAEKSVHFPDFIPEEDLPALYSGASLFVFPSLKEGFAMPVLEAQACGIPVVCSNIGSLPEAAREGALYFDPYDVEDMAEKMFEAYTNDQTIEKLIFSGFDNVNNFSWKQTVNQVLNIAEKIIKDRAKP